MIISGGYSITQETKNRITINLPQTVETLTCSSSVMGRRRKELSEDELNLVLLLVKKLFEKEET